MARSQRRHQPSVLRHSIIEARAQQRNFQLMVITHDEDFVELLGRSDHADYFFRVEKDARGRSRIIRCNMRELCN